VARWSTIWQNGNCHDARFRQCLDQLPKKMFQNHNIDSSRQVSLMRNAGFFSSPTAAALNYVDYAPINKMQSNWPMPTKLRKFQSDVAFAIAWAKICRRPQELILIAGAAAAAAALATWSVQDPASFLRPRDGSNALGAAGAIASDLFMQLLLACSHSSCAEYWPIWGWRLMFGQSLLSFQAPTWLYSSGNGVCRRYHVALPVNVQLVHCRWGLAVWFGMSLICFPLLL